MGGLLLRFLELIAGSRTCRRHCRHIYVLAEQKIAGIKTAMKKDERDLVLFRFHWKSYYSVMTVSLYSVYCQCAIQFRITNAFS